MGGRAKAPTEGAAGDTDCETEPTDGDWNGVGPAQDDQDGADGPKPPRDLISFHLFLLREAIKSAVAKHRQWVVVEIFEQKFVCRL